MTYITSLPQELLILVFDQLDRTTQIAECRLVCRAWNIPGERAMFGKELVISTKNTKIHTLYDILNKNPAKGHLIKHLHFRLHGFGQHPKIYHDIMHLAVTPNIQSLTGRIQGDDLFDTLIAIVRRSSRPFDKLKVQELESNSKECPLKLALEFKERLQSLHLDICNYSSQTNWFLTNDLDSFQRLTFLTLKTSIETVDNLDNLLDKFPHLKYLSLENKRWRHNNQARLIWNQETIFRNTTLKTLITGYMVCPPDYLEYLLYKYINLESIFVFVSLSSSSQTQHIASIAKIVQRVPQRELIYNVLAPADIRHIIATLKNKNYALSIERANSDGSSIQIKVHV